MLDTILNYAVQHPEQVAALATGLGATVTHYSKTGRLPLGRLPVRALRQAGLELGDRYFGKARPKGVPAILADTDLATLEDTLRAANFESGDLYSYEYHGEALNMRRPNDTRPHPKTGESVPMELHPRAFETANSGVLVICHDEASRWEATDAHLDGSLLSWERGRDELRAVLDQTDLDYREVESERAAEVEVV